MRVRAVDLALLSKGVDTTPYSKLQSRIQSGERGLVQHGHRSNLSTNKERESRRVCASGLFSGCFVQPGARPRPPRSQGARRRGRTRYAHAGSHIFTLDRCLQGTMSTLFIPNYIYFSPSTGICSGRRGARCQTQHARLPVPLNGAACPCASLSRTVTVKRRFCNSIGTTHLRLSI